MVRQLTTSESRFRSIYFVEIEECHKCCTTKWHTLGPRQTIYLHRFKGENVGVFLNIFCIKRLPRIYAQVQVRIKSPNKTDYNLY